MKFPVLDGHCDTASLLLHRGGSLAENEGHVDLARAARLDGYAQFFALFTAMRGGEGSQSELLERMYRNLMEQLAANPDRIRLCLSAAEVERAVEGGFAAALVSIEGAEGIDCDPGRLQHAWDLGVRMISLTWNHVNALAGCQGTDVGLTEQGREFVRRAQRLGMLIDVSHLSDRGFWDLCDITEGPIVASHSNARAVCGHPRNLTDDMFRQIVQTGGTAGINLYGDFLTEGETCTLEDVWRHAAHFLSLGGAKHLALGGDLDGCRRLPEPVTGVDGYRDVIGCLLAHGLSERETADISFYNLLEVVRTCGM